MAAVCTNIGRQKRRVGQIPPTNLLPYLLPEDHQSECSKVLNFGAVFYFAAEGLFPAFGKPVWTFWPSILQRVRRRNRKRVLPRALERHGRHRAPRRIWLDESPPSGLRAGWGASRCRAKRRMKCAPRGRRPSPRGRRPSPIASAIRGKPWSYDDRVPPVVARVSSTARGG